MNVLAIGMSHRTAGVRELERVVKESLVRTAV